MDRKIFFVLTGLFLGVYLLSAGLSYAAFTIIKPFPNLPVIQSPIAKNTDNTKSKFKYDPTLPRTEECPLNGAMYSKPQKEAWSQRRPMGIMIENSKAARPQSGLSSADIVYEAEAEGGITRFMGVFYCQDADFVGPIRSARTYYLDYISEYGQSPLYVHVGGANTPGPANALGQIESYGWGGYNDINQFSVGFPTFWRDYDRIKDAATEHTMYSTTDKLWSYAAQKRQLTNTETDNRTGKTTAWDAGFVKWAFKNDVDLASRPQASSVTFSLSNIQASYADDYVVNWKYDRDSNSYLRFNGGVPHLDLDTNSQLLAKNVVLIYTTLTVANDGYNEEGHGTHMLYGTKGSGKAQFLIDGKIIDGTWQKKNRLSRTLFFDLKGNPIQFNRGQIWIELLPLGTQISAK